MPWAPDYVTTEELTDYARIGDAVDDVQAALAVTAASAAVNNHCHRQFGQVAAPELRKYTARWSRRLTRWVIDIDDLQTTAGLVIQIGGTPVTLYDLEPVNAVAKKGAWTRLSVRPESAVQPTGDPYEVDGTAAWGWLAIPTVAKQATMLQGSRFLARRDSPFGIAGSPDQGSELRLLSRVDPDVAVVLGDGPPYVRARGVGW